ncbi:alpha-hydroxy-acid oxidizing protein [Nesterenkonia pannonica]|uniref:alpha-hydroxy-acid oxidizing protein n=1 Tax=Nesterenkonia pannonica TaxID=1548602 RepID=UPI002164CFC6|nr:alpha-hydroxy-acid oxidizing protein [Nesterenkonia pannonica]
MANHWFETVSLAEQRAKEHLPPSVYGALIAGSEKGVTIEQNKEAFAQIGFAPHVAGHKPHRELSTEVMGMQLSMPVLISPQECRRCTQKERSRWRALPPIGAPPSD